MTSSPAEARAREDAKIAPESASKNTAVEKPDQNNEASLSSASAVSSSQEKSGSSDDLNREVNKPKKETPEEVPPSPVQTKAPAKIVPPVDDEPLHLLENDDAPEEVPPSPTQTKAPAKIVPPVDNGPFRK